MCTHSTYYGRRSGGIHAFVWIEEETFFAGRETAKERERRKERKRERGAWMYWNAAAGERERGDTFFHFRRKLTQGMEVASLPPFFPCA